MNNFNDFDLDLNISKNKKSGDTRATGGPVCTGVVASILTGCTPDCITSECSKGCPVPSKDYDHRSCGTRYVGNAQVRC